MRLSSAVLACLVCLAWPNLAQGHGHPVGMAENAEPTLLITTARVLIETRDLERARVVLDEAIRQAPASAQARHERGRLLVQLGRIEQGIDELLVAHHLITARGRMHFERYALRLAEDDPAGAQAERDAYIDLVNAGAAVIEDLRLAETLARASTPLPERRSKTSTLAGNSAATSIAITRPAP